MKILEVKNLCKHYEKFDLKNVSFEIKPGKIIGFIGRNGGNKFLAIFSDCRRRDIDVFLKKVREACDSRNQASKTGDIGYASGFALNEGKEITELMANTDTPAASTNSVCFIFFQLLLFRAYLPY